MKKLILVIIPLLLAGCSVQKTLPAGSELEVRKGDPVSLRQTPGTPYQSSLQSGEGSNHAE